MCRSALIASVDGGTFDADTYTYTAPGHQNNILEFIDIAPPNASETFLSTVEHNAMARTADDMTAETNLRQDDISALSGGTENTVTLRQQVQAMKETAALQAQRIRDLEATKTSPKATLETPKHNKRSSQATDITPGEDDHTGSAGAQKDDSGYESPEEEKEEDDPFVDASENANSDFAGADEEEEDDKVPGQTIELSGDEESSEDEDYIPPSPKSPPARRSSAANKRTSSQRSPQTHAAVQGRRTSRRRNGAAPTYNE